MGKSFKHTDGGRSATGLPELRDGQGDCVCRALAVVLGRPFLDIWEALAQAGQLNPDDGVYMHDEWFQRWASQAGLERVSHVGWIGRYLVGISPPAATWGHAVAIINGVQLDTWDSRDKLNRYGFDAAWQLI